MPLCPSCGEDNPSRARFCMACTAPLQTASPDETRRIVTVVFSDLIGSTALGEALDPEALREILARYFDLFHTVLSSHGGTVEKYIGDAVMAVFGIPRAHEDDALRAVRAALEMRAVLDRLNEQLDVDYGVTLTNRTGVYTGEVVAGDPSIGQRLVTGDAVNTAARLEQGAPPGTVLIGEPTLRLVRHAVVVEPVDPVAAKGKAEPLAAFLLQEVRADAPGLERRLDAPLVGRQEELSELRRAYERARAQAAPELVLVAGEPGIGKTRLLHEFVASLPAATRVVTGRCPAYGEGLAFRPMAEAIHSAFSPTADLPAILATVLAGHPDADAVADRLAAVAGASDEAFPLPELNWAAAAFFEALAAERPLMALFDDLHWAEPAFLDLLGHALAEARGPILFACSTRTELLEDPPPWAQRATTLPLESLSTDEAGALIERRLSSTALPARIRQRILDASGGNPLFLEQMLGLLEDEGLLAPSATGVRWASVDLDIPLTISALLWARLDRLAPMERTVLQRASVPGLVFSKAGLLELCPDDIAPKLDDLLDGLDRKGFLRRGTSAIGRRDPETGRDDGDEQYRFRHVLIQEAVYAGILKRTRAELHERFGSWLERQDDEADELIGYHLERAHRLIRELSPLDARAEALGKRAAGRLSAAGSRALLIGDLATASGLFRRALDLATGDGPRRAEWLMLLGVTFREQGKLDEADEVLDEARQIAEQSDRVELRARVVVERFEVDMKRGTPGWYDRAEAEAERLLPELEARGANQAMAKVWRMLSWVHGEHGSLSGWDEASLRAIEYARLASDRREEVEVLAGLAINAAFGEIPAGEGIRRCEDLLRQVEGNRRCEAFVLSYLGLAQGVAGRYDDARGTLGRSLELLEQTGAIVWIPGWGAYSSRTERWSGNPRAAEARLRETFERVGHVSVWLRPELARALYDQSRVEEALEEARVAIDLEFPTDRAHGLAILGKIEARLGRIDAGLERTEEAARIVATTDDAIVVIETLSERADVLRMAGMIDQADVVARECLSRATNKGFTRYL